MSMPSIPADKPFFSVIMPVYNRASFVARALESCLRQSFPSFEIIVIDDGSTDASVATVRSFDDTRIRLVEHDVNQGRCPARNSGMRIARGEWFVFLDSDDELLPGALQAIHDDAVAAGSDVVGLRYTCVDESGRSSPEPAFREEELGYREYIESFERAVLSESMPCSRAATFPSVAFPEGHAEESLYHLDLAQIGRIRTSGKVVRLYHHDAPNQITRPSSRRTLQFAPDAARNVDAVLARHGSALQRYAPNDYARRLRAGALTHFLAGNRRAGLKYAQRHAARKGWTPKGAVIVLFGFLGPVPLAWSQELQGRARWWFTRWRRAS